jgi:putative copper export protein
VTFALESVLNGAAYLLGALSIGVLLLAGFFLNHPEDEAIRRRLARSVPIFIAVLVLIGALAVIVQGAKLSGGATPTADVIVRYLSRTQSGRIWLARETLLLALLLIAVWPWADTIEAGKIRLLFFLFLPFLASRSLISHAMALRENTALMVLSDAVHMLAVAFWAGGLPVLFWILWRVKGTKESAARAARLVQRFSRIALWSVCLLIPTGVYQSLTHLGGVHNLLDSSYGNTLTVKIVIVILMLLLGALNRFSTKPALLRLAASAAPGQRQGQAFSRIGWEGALGLTVLGLTGLLTTLPPGVHSDHLQAQQQPGTSRAAHVHVSSAGQAAPAEGAVVKILVPRERQIFQGDQIPLRFSFQKGKRGHHVHAYVDGELMGMFESAEGTLNGIKPGTHKLELRVVADDHQTELDARDAISFVVQ